MCVEVGIDALQGLFASSFSCAPLGELILYWRREQGRQASQ
jgi:hypothetical protein